MGYRSDVVCIIYPYGVEVNNVEVNKEEKYGLLKTLMATTFKDVVDAWGNNMEWLDADYILEFDIPDVKWYGSYPEVKCFEEMRERFEANDFDNFSIEFIRVGEEDDDVERCYSVDCEYFLQTSTAIARGHR
jgi:hypothetical protein